ncbi:MAG: galactose-1-phosphate uridylyltransferase [Pirellulales bacterium]|nr:galactose-1-phosphate uridylyltransferase [Pirellulales bacterium]
MVGRRVFIAEDRAGRPNDYSKSEEVFGSSSVAKATVALCPFCAGHEEQTPEPLFTVSDAHGDWRVRVVPNKYPAVMGDAESAAPTGLSYSLLKAEPSVGAHEVIIESPRHLHDITEMSLEELTVVLQMFRARLQHWAEDGRMQHAIVFKNVGSAAGASLEHVHSQLLAMPFIPEGIMAELQGAHSYFAKHQACLFCRLLEEEMHQGARLVAEEGSLVAFCAYAGRQPYETWILPNKHAAHYGELSDEETMSLAKILRQVLLKLQVQVPALSYNLVLHTAPFHHDCHLYYHWHWELIPRTSQLAGLEWGTNTYVNPLAPERAAAKLREN